MQIKIRARISGAPLDWPTQLMERYPTALGRLTAEMAVEGYDVVFDLISIYSNWVKQFRDFMLMSWQIVPPFPISPLGMGSAVQGDIGSGIAPIAGYISGNWPVTKGMPFPLHTMTASGVAQRVTQRGSKSGRAVLEAIRELFTAEQ